MDPTGTKKEGDFLRYGDEVVLLDDQRLVWNNVQGSFGGIGPRLPGARGEMHLKFRRSDGNLQRNTSPAAQSSTTNSNSSSGTSGVANASSNVSNNVDGSLSPSVSADVSTSSADLNSAETDIVNYGDSGVLLDVITIRRRVNEKRYSQTISNYKRQSSRTGPEGGYLVSNGKGLSITFAIHNAQPYVTKLLIRASHEERDTNKDVHHNVSWGQPISFTASTGSLPCDAEAREKATAAIRKTNQLKHLTERESKGITTPVGSQDTMLRAESQSKEPTMLELDQGNAMEKRSIPQLLHSGKLPFLVDGEYGVIVFMLTNGGRGVISKNQVVASSTDQNGFWVDLFANGRNKGCVRVSCCREAANQMARRLSARDSISSDGTDYEAMLQQNGQGVLLRKLNRLRQIPKLMESNIVGAGRRIGIEVSLRELRRDLRKAPHNLVHGVRRVGGGIHRTFRSKIRRTSLNRRCSQDAEVELEVGSDEDPTRSFWQPGNMWVEEDRGKESTSVSAGSIQTQTLSPKARKGLRGVGFGKKKRIGEGNSSTPSNPLPVKAENTRESGKKSRQLSISTPKESPKQTSENGKQRPKRKGQKSSKEARTKVSKKNRRKKGRQLDMGTTDNTGAANASSQEKVDITSNKYSYIFQYINRRWKWIRRRLRPIIRMLSFILIFAAWIWQPQDDRMHSAILYLSRRSSMLNGGSSMWAPLAYRTVVLAQRLYECVFVMPIYLMNAIILALPSSIFASRISDALLSLVAFFGQEKDNVDYFTAPGCPVDSARVDNEKSKNDMREISLSFVDVSQFLYLLSDPAIAYKLPIQPLAQDIVKLVIQVAPFIIALLLIATVCGFSAIGILRTVLEKVFGVKATDIKAFFGDDIIGLNDVVDGPNEEESTEELVWELTLHEWDPRTAKELNAILTLSDGTVDEGASESTMVSSAAPDDTTTSNEQKSGKVDMGHSLVLAKERTPESNWDTSWEETSASKFSLRGANYLSDKKKVPSEQSLFETIAGDGVVSYGPSRHFGARVNIPDFSESHPHLKRHMGPEAESPVPAIIVFNCQIPLEPQQMFGAQKLPPTINAVFYMRLRKETAEQLAILEGEEAAAARGDTADVNEAKRVPGAVRLLHRWCRDARTDQALRGQLKAVASARNLSEIGAPSVVAKWNGKPVLLARNAIVGGRVGFAQLYRTNEYLEIDIDASAEFG